MTKKRGHPSREGAGNENGTPNDRLKPVSLKCLTGPAWHPFSNSVELAPVVLSTSEGASQSASLKQAGEGAGMIRHAGQ